MSPLAWDVLVSLSAVTAPLVAVPLSVMIFYLRQLRGDQEGKHREVDQRLQAVTSENVEMRRQLGSLQRDSATKEEWLRESMKARQSLERLSESVVRCEERIDRMHEQLNRGERWAKNRGMRSRTARGDRTRVGDQER